MRIRQKNSAVSESIQLNFYFSCNGYDYDFYSIYLFVLVFWSGLPGVVFILPDSYLYPETKEYGGQFYSHFFIIYLLLILNTCFFCTLLVNK